MSEDKLDPSELTPKNILAMMDKVDRLKRGRELSEKLAVDDKKRRVRNVDFEDAKKGILDALDEVANEYPLPHWMENNVDHELLALKIADNHMIHRFIDFKEREKHAPILLLDNLDEYEIQGNKAHLINMYGGLYWEHIKLKKSSQLGYRNAWFHKNTVKHDHTSVPFWGVIFLAVICSFAHIAIGAGLLVGAFIVAATDKSKINYQNDLASLKKITFGVDAHSLESAGVEWSGDVDDFIRQ